MPLRFRCDDYYSTGQALAQSRLPESTFSFPRGKIWGALGPISFLPRNSRARARPWLVARGARAESAGTQVRRRRLDEGMCAGPNGSVQRVRARSCGSAGLAARCVGERCRHVTGAAGLVTGTMPGPEKWQGSHAWWWRSASLGACPGLSGAILNQPGLRGSDQPESPLVVPPRPRVKAAGTLWGDPGRSAVRYVVTACRWSAGADAGRLYWHDGGRGPIWGKGPRPPGRAGGCTVRANAPRSRAASAMGVRKIVPEFPDWKFETPFLMESFCLRRRGGTGWREQVAQVGGSPKDGIAALR
ncbi:hypothetical protein P3T39_006945 [Kitasatospora sp. GP82]|nr:hypothetical protein [Kitasatospora sp. GP82]